jgi:hypothetical protein
MQTACSLCLEDGLRTCAASSSVDCRIAVVGECLQMAETALAAATFNAR